MNLMFHFYFPKKSYTMGWIYGRFVFCKRSTTDEYRIGFFIDF